MTEVVRVGVDVEAVARFETVGRGLFTARELSETEANARPAESRAGRWCAKEAVVKAVSGAVLLSPREVEVVADHTGRPRVRLPERARDYVLDVDVSISHSAGFAIAVAAARVVKPDRDTDNPQEKP